MAIKLKAKGVVSKANPNVTFKDYPDVNFDGVRNLDLPEEDRVYLVMEHVTAGERQGMRAVDYDPSAGVSTSLLKVWNRKVKEVGNLLHPDSTDKNIRYITAEELPFVYGSSQANAIIAWAYNRLMDESELTDDEIKN